MKGQLKKVISDINSVHQLPKRIIIHGIQFAIALVLIAMGLYFVNINQLNFNYDINFISFSLAETGLIIFAEAVIGGLVVDYFVKKLDSSK